MADASDGICGFKDCWVALSSAELSPGPAWVFSGLHVVCHLIPSYSPS